MKRFAKVSGEMVSLSGGGRGASARSWPAGKTWRSWRVSDEKRGESLIVVTNNAAIELKTVRETLKANGFSDLAVPRRVVFLKEMPKLGTGKIDYVRLQEVIESQVI